MAEEFETQGKLIHEMDEQIQNYGSAGKKEAANRLKEQLILLEVNFFFVLLIYFQTIWERVGGLRQVLFLGECYCSFVFSCCLFFFENISILYQ